MEHKYIFYESLHHSAIIQFIYWNWIDLVIIIALWFGACLVFSKLFCGNNGKAKKVIFQLVLNAEKELGSNTGRIKKQKVLSEFYSQFPIMGFLVPEARASVFVDEAAHNLREMIQSNDSTLLSYTEETSIINNKDSINKLVNLLIEKSSKLENEQKKGCDI